MQGADRDLVKIWQKMNAPRFDNIMLKTKTVGAKATPQGIEVTFAAAEEGGTAPAPQVYDLVLQAVGRTPNGKKSPPKKPVWRSPTAASSTSISRCAPTCRTSLPLAT